MNSIYNSHEFERLSFEFVKRLPRKKCSTKIYVKETTNGYKEYLWLNNKWNLLGTYVYTMLYERDGKVYILKDDVYTQL